MIHVCRYLLFKGDLGHMVLGSLGNSKKKRGKSKKDSRLTLLVNYWDKMPMQPYCRPISDATWLDMVGQKSMDGAAAVWPDARSRAPGYTTDQKVVRPMELLVGDGGATLSSDTGVKARYEAEQLVMREIEEPQTYRFFFVRDPAEAPSETPSYFIRRGYGVLAVVHTLVGDLAAAC